MGNKLAVAIVTLMVVAGAFLIGGRAFATQIHEGNDDEVVVGNCENRQDCHQWIKITKVFSPHNQTPTVDLMVKNSQTNFLQQKGLVHDGGYATFKVDSGMHVISESGTVLKDYIASIDCGETATPTKTGDFSWSYSQLYGHNVTCTVTNTLKETPPEGGRGGGETTTATTGGQGGGTAQVATTPTGAVNAGFGSSTVSIGALTGLLASVLSLGLGVRHLKTNE